MREGADCFSRVDLALAGAISMGEPLPERTSTATSDERRSLAAPQIAELLRNVWSTRHRTPPLRMSRPLPIGLRSDTAALGGRR